MIYGYIVIEGQANASILKHMLPATAIAGIHIVGVRDAYSAQSMAISLLARRGRAVLLILQAKSESRDVIEDCVTFAEEILNRAASERHFEVDVEAEAIYASLMRDLNFRSELIKHYGLSAQKLFPEQLIQEVGQESFYEFIGGLPMGTKNVVSDTHVMRRVFNFNEVASSTFRGKPFEGKALEQAFHQEMLDLYTKAGKETKKWHHMFLKRVKAIGGVRAVKHWMSKPITSGFIQNAEDQRLDLTVEAYVVRFPWSQLFSETEKETAAKRLRRWGFRGDLPNYSTEWN